MVGVFSGVLLEGIRAEGSAVDPAKGKALENGDHHRTSFRPNGPTIRLDLQCGERLGLWPEIRWRGRYLLQGCALRWANLWAFGPNIKQAADRNLSKPDTP